MVTLLVPGIDMHDDTEGAIVQSAEVTHKKEESTVKGMVNGKTQTVRSFEHSEMNEFSVTGKGDFTMEAGLGQDAGLSTLITGGVVFIGEFKYMQKIADTSEWSYNGRHHPHAT